MASVRAQFPDGFDVVVPCLLDGDGMNDALDCVALGGKIVMYGCIGGWWCRVVYTCLYNSCKRNTTRDLLVHLVPRKARSGLHEGSILTCLPMLLAPYVAGPCKDFDFFKMHRRRAEIYSTEPRRDIDSECEVDYRMLYYAIEYVLLLLLRFFCYYLFLTSSTPPCIRIQQYVQEYLLPLVLPFLYFCSAALL